MAATYTFDSTSLIKDGKRWFPTMGEIHYSRVSCDEWEEELSKMKAGGVDIASVYVIWIHHEEIEGKYDWAGDKNLKKFVECVQKSGLKLCLRIGPWCHGEVRNGGFPDWLLKKDFSPRTNDEKYFAAIEKWYAEIFEQVSSFFKGNPDENPIIACQIENEYGHCGGIPDETGDEHMKRLAEIAKKNGFVVPLYTATGWGGARTGGLLPVMGGYCDAPWDPRTIEIEPSGNYVFTRERNDHNIGSDFGLGHGITFDTEKFPYLTAELGGGLQVTKHRRPVATSKDIAAVALVKLGSGCNLLGYYMYHGGTNPDGILTTLEESKISGSLNDLPVKNYDFRAPIGEFGKVSDTMKELKLLSYFAHDFGEVICPLPALIPDDNPLDPKDTKNLRYSYRTDGRSGFVFVNNYVRHKKMAEHKNVALKTPDGKNTIANVDIKDGDFFFFPFNVELAGIKIKSARATPLCIVDTEEGKKVVFYKREGETAKDDEIFDLENKDDIKKIILISREEALNAWKIGDGKGETNIFISKPNEIVYEVDGKTVLVSREEGEPPTSDASTDTSTGSVTDTLQDASSPSATDNFISDVIVKINYIGNSARLYTEESGEKKLIYDHFFMGEDYPWEISLRYLSKKVKDFSKMYLEIEPLEKGENVYIEKWPDFKDETTLEKLVSIEYETEYICCI